VHADILKRAGEFPRPFSFRDYCELNRYRVAISSNVKLCILIHEMFSKFDGLPFLVIRVILVVPIVFFNIC
jgi:hypothetical protein